ncbi:MAG: DUF2807 domain-containing protein [Bacteroidales bacterium]|nr:DUF2807 domain-containing protein [Bacteroidales bacterium]
MKKIILTTAAFVFLTNFLSAETRTLNLGEFTKIAVHNTFSVILVPSDNHEIVAAENLVLPEKLTLADVVTVKEGTLTITMPSSQRNNRGRNNEPKGDIIVHFKSLNELVLAPAVNVKSEGTIETAQLRLVLSGASNAKLDVVADQITSIVSGASDLTLSGITGNHDLTVSGASSAKVRDLSVQQTSVRLAGASNADVTTQNMTGSVSGPSTLRHNSDAQGNVSRSAGATVTRHSGSVSQNTSQNSSSGMTITEDGITMPGGITITEDGITIPGGITITEDGITMPGVSITERGVVVESTNGAKEFAVSTGTGGVKVTKNSKKSKKFNPVFGFLDLGLNGYEKDFFRGNLPTDYENMRLSLSSSFVLNLNVIQYGIRLGRSDFGIATSLGVGWNNYKFLEKDMIPGKLHSSDAQDRRFVIAPYDGLEARDFRKSRIQSSWLKVPLALQYNQRKGFNASVGIVSSVKLGSSSKQVYTEGGSKKQRHKVSDDFYLAGFRADAEVRVGYKQVSAFATYSLTKMFVKDKGPDLAMFSFGLSFFPYDAF